MSPLVQTFLTSVLDFMLLSLVMTKIINMNRGHIGCESPGQKPKKSYILEIRETQKSQPGLAFHFLEPHRELGKHALFALDGNAATDFAQGSLDQVQA